jgi:capsular exopolysaccharide synthesis family protein
MKILKVNTALADAVANARTHILFSMPYDKSRRIMLTSAIPAEGKSMIASLLALSLTTLGRKILLIDADLRKPSLHRYLGLRNDKGLADYLVGLATLDEIIQSVKDSPLQIITSGALSRNPSELLASERFRELLDKCGERYDRVVIDVPPVLYIPDGLIIAKVVHTGILVCGAGMVHKKTIRQVREKFDSVGYAFIGAIINRADFDRQGYRYKYYNTYKNYYASRQRPIQNRDREMGYR